MTVQSLVPFLGAMLLTTGQSLALEVRPAVKRGDADRQAADLLAGRFQWTIGEPLVAPAARPEDPCYSVKDPSVVFHQGRWHLFLTIRSETHSHQIEYLSFADWKDANAASRHVLKMHDGVACAPQVFYSPAKEMVSYLPGQR